MTSEAGSELQPSNKPYVVRTGLGIWQQTPRLTLPHAQPLIRLHIQRRPIGNFVFRISIFRLLLGLEVVEEDRALLRLLTPVLDNDARAVDDLAGVALTVEDACGYAC